MSSSPIQILPCDLCHTSLVDCEINVINFTASLRRLRKATGFEIFVQEVKKRYGLPNWVAARVAREIWVRKEGFFWAPYWLIALRKIRLEMSRKLEECNRMIISLE